MKSHALPRSSGISGLTPALQPVPQRAEIRRVLEAPQLQTKLTLGSPGDEHEREADRVAEEVTRGGTAEVSSQPPVRELRRSATGAAAPAQAPRSVHETLRSPGRPLERGIRERLESRFGLGFGGVRIHTDSQADASARAVSARAYTVGSHIAFAAGEYAPGTQEGDRLLAHELAHVAQQSGETSPGVVRRKGGAPRSRAPFDKVLKLHGEAADALRELARELHALPNPTEPLKERIEAIEKRAQRSDEQKAGATEVVDAWIAGKEPPVDAPVDALNYVYDDKPSAKGLEMLERMETNVLALVDLVLPRVKELSQAAEDLGPDAPLQMREAFHIVAGYYLDLIPRASSNTVFEEVTFLDTFYQDPRIIQGYGLWAYIRAELPDLYENLLLGAEGGEHTFALDKTLKGDDPRISDTTIRDFFDKGLQGKRAGEIAITVNAVRDLKKAEEGVGTLPAHLGEVRRMPDPEVNAGLARMLMDVQVRVAILRLWQPIDPLRGLLHSQNNAGQSLFSFSKSDRTEWLEEMVRLEGEFADELREGDHPNIGDRIDAWQKRVLALVDKIPPEVRQKKIIAAIVEQIPFMFVAGATAARMGLWVRAATQSKWLAALAEGATMTLFSAASIPANAPNRPQGALGWTANLAVNVLFARVGRLFFEVGDKASHLAFTRSLIASFGTRIVIPTVSLTALQTGVQLVEAKIHDTGGETSFTELMTINLVLNGIGMAVGAATVAPSRPGGAAPPPGSTALAKPTAADLARQLNVPTAEALLLLEVAARLDDFKASVAALNEAAARGKLTRAQFDAFKKQGLDLADFLEARLGPLAKAGAFGATTPAQAKAFLDTARARLNGMTWETGTKVQALLPEGTPGLVRVGEGQQWVYDRARPPRRLDALRADYEKRGNTVRALPSGGWEAADSKGLVLARVIPVSQQAVQALSKSVADVAKGPLAKEGLTRLRSQTAIPANLLEAQLQQALSAPGGEAAVPRVLQHLARFVDPANTRAWEGLSRYLDLGGDPKLLARSMAYAQTKEFAAESKMLANKLLEHMAGWDAEAVEGFGALFRLKPNLTAERVLNLVASFEPAQVQGILQSLAVLEPRSRGLGKVLGPLTSGAEMSMRGGMGAIASGVELAKRYPGATLVFEEPVTNAAGDVIRVTDISVQETTTTRVAGKTITTTTEIVAVEVKEVSSDSLGKRADQELARDIARDSVERSKRLTPVGAARPFFETFIWRIRANEIRQQAVKALGPGATPQQIDAKMRSIVENSLKKVFDRSEFKKLPQAEQDGYRAAFKGVPFVEFF